MNAAISQCDERGDLRSVENVNRDVVSNPYDENGNKTSTTYPDGRAVSYTCDRMSRMTGVTGTGWGDRQSHLRRGGRRTETSGSTLTTAEKGYPPTETPGVYSSVIAMNPNIPKDKREQPDNSSIFYRKPKQHNHLASCSLAGCLVQKAETSLKALITTIIRMEIGFM